MPTTPKGSTPGLITPPAASHPRDGSISSSAGCPASPLSSPLSDDEMSKSTLALTDSTITTISRDEKPATTAGTAIVVSAKEKEGVQPVAHAAAVVDGRDGDYSSSRDQEKDVEAENWPAPTLSRTATGIETPYPEGGKQAWLVVFGSFMGMFCAFGFMNSIGVFHSYLHEHQLSSASSSTIGWIFSVYIFLSFGLGLQIGPVFDAYGPTLLLTAGVVLLTLAVVAMSFCTTYWHFMLSVGVLAGSGTSLVFTPSISAIGHWFYVKRGAATGLAATGGSLGGIIFPLMLQRLFDSLGWAWALRVLALIIAVCGVVCVLLVRSRLPRRPGSSVWPDMTILRDRGFALTTAGVFFMEWGLFIPITYLASYISSTRAVGEDSSLPFTILAILNAGSCLGRYLPGLFADRVGRFNSMIVMLAFCMLTSLCLWLPASLLPTTASHALTVKILVIVYAALFGFASGSNISLTPVCVGQLCKTEEYGRYYATCYTIVAVGTLTGIPIAGALLQACDGGYMGVVLFTGGCYFMSLVSMMGARYTKIGWSMRKY